jgi:hypothetical protein
VTAARPISLAAAVACLTALAACSSSGTSTPTGSATPSATPTPTATPTGPPVIVWTVKAGGGAATLVRELSPTGALAHTIATLPGDAVLLGQGSGKVAFLYTDKSIHVVVLGTGAVTSFPSGAAPADCGVFGGAFSPDGMNFAYAISTPSSGSLRVLNLGSGTSTAIHTYSTNTVDAPLGWTSTRMYATSIPGCADAGAQADVALDPATGMETSSTSIAGADGTAFSPDGIHVADSIHTMLGDEGDSTVPIGPQQPFNTLRTFTLGATPSSAYSMAHHQISVFALSADGGTVVYYNDSSAGGFAGISISPDFGLFFRHGTSATQLTHYGEVGRWDAGAFIDSSDAVMAVHTATGEQLVIVGPSHTTPMMIDSVTGGDQPSVKYSPTS